MTVALLTAKLGEIAKLNPSLPVSLPGQEAVSFVPMAAVDADSVSAVDTETRRYDEVNKGYTPFIDGDVLVAKITPCFENGKIAQARLTRRYGFGSTEFHVVRPNAELLDARYLVYYLRQHRIRLDGERRMTGSAGQRRVPEHFLAGLTVPMLPLPEQRRIAAILDSAEALRVKRRAALAQLDTLTQAIFFEMFGEPAENQKQWRHALLGDVVLSASDGPHVSPVYIEDGIPFLSTRHVRAGEIIWNDLKYISREDAEIQWKKCKPQRGDILYTKGGTTGLAATVRTDQQFAVWVHVALLKPNLEKVDPIWLESMLNSDYCYRQSQVLTHGIANRDLGLTRMINIRLFLPPLAVQKDFVSRMAVVEKFKHYHRSALAGVDALFASLQNRAFRGEL